MQLTIKIMTNWDFTITNRN